VKRKVPGKNIFPVFEELRGQLKQIIYDQDEAIDTVVDAFVHMAFKPLELPPRAIFTFLGPPAVGKISLARALTALLAEYSAFKQFDMEQYADPESSMQLLAMSSVEGMPDGELVSFINNHPRSIVLFDSIEEADNGLQLALLDLLTRAPGEGSVDCSEIIVIFTSTLGSALYQSKGFLNSFKQEKLRAQALVMEAIANEKKMVFETVQNAIAPKLLAALSHHHVILFNRLSLDSIVRVGADALQRMTEHFTAQSNIVVEYQEFDDLVRMLTLSFAPYINVKRVKQKLPDALLFKITQFIRFAPGYPEKVTFKLSRQAKTFLSRLHRESDNLLQKLFKKNETVELTWKEYARGGQVFFSIDHAALIKLPTTKEYLREERPGVRFSTLSFAEIAGNKSTKNTLRQIINLLKEPGLVEKFGIDMPKGLLLYGPEGVGKTMLGKAFATEAERPYVYVSRSELFDPYYISRAFQKARQFAPSIVFLDGIDFKGLVEGAYATMPVDQLLMELDALPTDPEESIFTIATAQNKDDVSPLLIAPDRIDIFVEVPELDKEARRFFIEKIIERPNNGKIDLDKVVRYISGMNGYDLQRIGKEASLYAIRHGLDCITEEILIEQINIIKYGSKLEKTHVHNLEEELKMTAYHEAGHAVLSCLLLPEIKIEQVTIAPRLHTLGFISYTFEDFPGNVSKAEVFNNICVLIAGRVASIKKFGDKGIDSGASVDLEQATHQAYAAVASLGMDKEVGYVHTETLTQNVSRQFFLAQVETRVTSWIKEATVKAEELVERHWETIDTLAAILIRHEIVDGEELLKLMRADTKKSTKPVAHKNGRGGNV
jgi:ATP-dependent Zn protease